MKRVLSADSHKPQNCEVNEILCTQLYILKLSVESKTLEKTLGSVVEFCQICMLVMIVCNFVVVFALCT